VVRRKRTDSAARTTCGSQAGVDKIAPIRARRTAYEAAELDTRP